MLVTVDVLKKMNDSIASGNPPLISDLISECALDEAILKESVGDLGKSISSMTVFFQTMTAYLAEVQKRVKVMSECYFAIQKLQLKYSIIEATPDVQDPPIVWNNQS